MSLIPLIFGDYDYYRPSRIMDQHFGLGLDPEDLFTPVSTPHTHMMILRNPNNYYRPWRSSASNKDSGSIVKTDENKFQVNLDVQQFAPEDITVKISGENMITIEGKHEEKQDEHGFISRHFVRRYVLPKGHDLDKIESKLSSDGVLTITAPRVDAKTVEHRSIPITRTGQPMKPVEKKSNEKEIGDSKSE